MLCSPIEVAVNPPITISLKFPDILYTGVRLNVVLLDCVYLSTPKIYTISLDGVVLCQCVLIIILYMCVLI